MHSQPAMWPLRSTELLFDQREREKSKRIKSKIFERSKFIKSSFFIFQCVYTFLEGFHSAGHATVRGVRGDSRPNIRPSVLPDNIRLILGAKSIESGYLWLDGFWFGARSAAFWSERHFREE